MFCFILDYLGFFMLMLSVLRPVVSWVSFSSFLWLWQCCYAHSTVYISNAIPSGVCILCVGSTHSQGYSGSGRVQKFACRIATHLWSAGYDDLLSLLELSSLDRRRLEQKLCYLFKFVHDLCFFPPGLVTLRGVTYHTCTCTAHCLQLKQPFAHTSSFYNT